MKNVANTVVDRREICPKLENRTMRAILPALSTMFLSDLDVRTTKSVADKIARTAFDLCNASRVSADAAAIDASLNRCLIPEGVGRVSRRRCDVVNPSSYRVRSTAAKRTHQSRRYTSLCDDVRPNTTIMKVYMYNEVEAK